MSGTYDRNREFVLTSSPSMDILISSNLERLIYHAAGNDAAKNSELMDSLKRQGKYTITDDMKKAIDDFYGAYAKEEEAFGEIKEVFEKTGYVIDTHTAVASYAESVYRRESGDDTPNVIISTASPYKFAKNVYYAITGETTENDLEAVDKLSMLSKTGIPSAISEIRNAGIIHDKVCEISEMRDLVESVLIKGL